MVGKTTVQSFRQGFEKNHYRVSQMRNALEIKERKAVARLRHGLISVLIAGYGGVTETVLFRVRHYQYGLQHPHLWGG